MLRSEVEVLSWSPDRGNPTLKRQGRGPELTGRFQCGLVMRCGVSVRAGLEEAIGVSWWRTKVKRRKAFLGGRAVSQRRCPIPIDPGGRSGGAITTKSQRFTPGDLLGSSRVWLVGRRTRGRRLMAQQKSEDRVVPEGGVMPIERAGSSPGGQGKAVPVEETAVQLSLTIVTAENPRGATRRRSRDRLGAIRAGAPMAIGNAERAAPATMEEVAKRLTSALLKVASNKGA